MLNSRPLDRDHRLRRPKSRVLSRCGIVQRSRDLQLPRDRLPGAHESKLSYSPSEISEFEGGGSGRAKKPILTYDGLEIDIPFTGSEDSVGTAAP